MAELSLEGLAFSDSRLKRDRSRHRCLLFLADRSSFSHTRLRFFLFHRLLPPTERLIQTASLPNSAIYRAAQRLPCRRLGARVILNDRRGLKASRSAGTHENASLLCDRALDRQHRPRYFRIQELRAAARNLRRNRKAGNRR